MAHAKGAVTPSSRKVMEEANPSEQHYTSLVNVHDEEDDAITRRSRTKPAHRRHQSLFSASSAPVDLSDYPSMRRQSFSTTETGFRKSTSGDVNSKLGEFWSRFRAPSKKTTTRMSLDETSLSVDQKPLEIQRKTEVVGFREIDEAGVRRPPPPASSLSAGRKGERRERREAHGLEVKSASTRAPIGSDEAISGALGEVDSPVDATSKSTSLHFISLNLFSSSSGSLGVSSTPLEQSERLEPSEAPTLSTKWRDIQGGKNWHGLIDPLDLDLRKELLRYGDFAQLAYDNFECNSRSKYAGSARFSKQKLFQKLHQQGCGYEVTRYLYATSDTPLHGVLVSPLSSTSWDMESNWMGYVAVATDSQEIERLGRRDILVAWRGAGGTLEWLVDAQTQMTQAKILVENSKAAENHHPKVERGFWSLYTSKRPTSHFNCKSASEQILTELKRLVTLYEGENLSITLTGHSVGGALAILSAYEIAERGLHKLRNGISIPVAVFTFGSPHIGDGAFRKRFAELQLKVLRVVNVPDVVPKNIANFGALWGLSDASKHVGVELQVNHKLSPYLRSTRDVLDCHNLECYLHAVDGYVGLKSKSFELVTGRDYALVNKYSDLLLERFCVPSQWWQAENKGLEMSYEGRWMEPDRQPDDTPSLANHERFL